MKRSLKDKIKMIKGYPVLTRFGPGKALQIEPDDRVMVRLDKGVEYRVDHGPIELVFESDGTDVIMVDYSTLLAKKVSGTIE